MNFWILQTGEPLHSDYDFSRGMRAINLSDKLNAAGHDVILWSSSFNHTKKIHRSYTFKSILINKNLSINLIPSPGYKNNIGFKRLYDHFILALNLHRILNINKLPLPDAIFVGFPPIETSFVMLNWAHKNKIPTIIDVKDQWPQIFVNVFPIKFKTIGKIIFSPYFYLTRKCFYYADLHVSMTKKYIDWMALVINNTNKKYLISPLTSKLQIISSTVNEENILWWSKYGVNLNNRNRFIFVGSFSKVFNFDLIYNLVEKFSFLQINCQFVFCGNGDRELYLKNKFNKYPNVIFPGWIDVNKYVLLANSSTACIAPYISTIDFMYSIPNKIIDALAYKLPIISTLDGEVKNLIIKHNVGFHLDSNTFDKTVYKLIDLLNFDNNFDIISHNAFNLYNEKFNFDKIYNKLVEELEILSNKDINNN